MPKQPAPESPSSPSHREFDERLESLRRELDSLRRWIGRERAAPEPRSFERLGREDAPSDQS